ncbi:MAG: hypothetical protein GY697_00575 [Desulfobacterales bacterium]|nr:hypothetical protein [Desulfobacterales bacterium]
MEVALSGKRVITRFFVSYPRHMLQLLALDSAAVRDLFKKGFALPYCSVNVFVFGLIYGLAAIYFSQPVLGQNSGQTAGTFNPLMIIMVGVSVAFLMHAGAALFLWVFCRGIGGSPFFAPVYMGMGAAAIAFWPLAPGLAALQANCLGLVLALFSMAAALYAAIVVYVTVREVSRLSHLKMSIACAVTLIYVGCFMYLWT